MISVNIHLGKCINCLFLCSDGGMADTEDLKSSVLIERKGSSPFLSTKLQCAIE